MGKRDADFRNGFSLPKTVVMKNLEKYAREPEKWGMDPKEDNYRLRSESRDMSTSWPLIAKVKRISGLKVIAKGM